MEILSSELGKWTKSMLVDFILSKSLLSGIKLSDKLSQKLSSLADPVMPSSNSSDVANILQSIVSELKTLFVSNLKMHDKLNRLGMTGSTDNVVKLKPPAVTMQVTQPASGVLDLSRKTTFTNGIF